MRQVERGCLNRRSRGPRAALFLARAGQDQVPTLKDSIDRFVAEALKQNTR